MPAVGVPSMAVSSEHLASADYLPTFQHIELNAWRKR
jgi:hypothetical protein